MLVSRYSTHPILFRSFSAEWRIHGVLKFELHATVAEDARRKMIKGEIDCDNLKLQLLVNQFSDFLLTLRCAYLLGSIL